MKWETLIKNNKVDIYFSPYYLKIWDDYGDGEVQAFYYESSSGKVLYPYLFRRIPLDEINKSFYDITTAYGYGGPIILECIQNYTSILISEFRNAFNKYAKKNGIISEFIRFHPMYKNYEYFIDQDIECEYSRNTIKVDLASSGDCGENILMNMESKTRNQVRQSLRNGMDIHFYTEPTLDEINIFTELYNLTMERVDADYYYKFTSNYFLNTFAQLRENIELACVTLEDRIISSAIFLFSDNFVHYHLSASLHGYNKFRPNNFMLYQAALRYKQKGMKYFHLGGGYKENDSLYKFKKGFNKNGILDFYIGKKIHDIKIYNKLVEIWKKENNLDNSFNSDYFPLYRFKV